MSIHTDKQKQTLDLSDQARMGKVINSIDKGEYKKWWSSDALSWQGIVQYLPAIKLALSDTATFNDEQKAFLVSRLDHFSRLCRAYVESHGGVGGFRWTAVGKKRVELAQELCEAANRKIKELAPEKKFDLSDNMPLPEVGMQNPANACYMISTLQQLFRLPTLKAFFEKNFFDNPADTISRPEGMNDTAFEKLKTNIRNAFNAGKPIESINKPTEIGSDEWDKIKNAAILYHAQCLFDMIKFSKNNVPLSTSATSKHLRALGYTGSQKDAGEAVLDPILKACNRFAFDATNLTTRTYFELKLSNTVIPSETPPSPSPYLNTNFPEMSSTDNKKTLTINDLFKASFITTVQGHNINGNPVDSHIHKLTDCPENLIINLSRFTCDMYGHRKKLNNSVSGLEEIDLTPYLDEEVFVVAKNPENTTKRAKYKLFGAQIHRGSTNRGHYYSYVRKSVTSDAWIKYNDGTVSECKYDGIKNDIATQGYILYYVVEEPEKRAKNNGTSEEKDSTHLKPVDEFKIADWVADKVRARQQQKSLPQFQENSPPSKPVDISTIMPWIVEKVTARQRKKNLQEWRENNGLTEDRPLPKIGMKNPALACYMISTLQQLFRLPDLKRFFEENTFVFPTDTTDKLYNSRLTLYHAQSIFDFMKLEKGKCLGTSKSLNHLNGLGYTGRANDGQEVIMRIIGACNDLNFAGTTMQTKKTSIKIANGTPVSTETSDDDPQSTLEVELDADNPSMKLEDLLGKYFAEAPTNYTIILPDSKKSFSALVEAYNHGNNEIDDYIQDTPPKYFINLKKLYQEGQHEYCEQFLDISGLSFNEFFKLHANDDSVSYLPMRKRGSKRKFSELFSLYQEGKKQEIDEIIYDMSENRKCVKDLLDDYYSQKEIFVGKPAAGTLKKLQLITSLPQNLIISLKRFAIDPVTKIIYKLNNKVEIPQELDLKKYTIEGFDGQTKYRLVGAQIHNGGHYYSYVRDRDKEDSWDCFNDRSVSLNSKYSAIKNEIDGDGHSYTNAYVLYYEKIE